MSVAQGTDKRARECLVRISAEAKRRLKNFADERKVSMAEALDLLVPKVRKSDMEGECRYCRRWMKNPRGKHDAHLERCPLWAEN